MIYGRQQTPEETVALLEAVTQEQVGQLARQLLRPELMSFSAVGKVDPAESYLKIFGSDE